MRAALPRVVIRRVAVVQGLLEVQFWFPLWLIFLLDRGIGLGTALLADGVFRLVSLAAEVPVGRMADRLGRRRTVLLTCTSSCVLFVAIACVTGPVSLYSVWILWGLVWALTTGAVSSYLYEFCQANDVDAGRAFAIVRSSGAAGVLASLAAAGYLYTLSPSLPFLLTGALSLVAAIIAWGLPDSPHPEPPGSRASAAILSAWRGDICLRHAWVVLVAVLAIGWTVRILFQPLALDIGLSSAQTGWMYAVFAAAGFSGHLATALIGRRHRIGWALLCLALVSATSLATGLSPRDSPWIFLPVMGVAYSLATTVLEVAIHDRVHDSVRSTALALAAACSGLIIAGARPALGWGSELASVASAFVAWGVIGAIVTILLGSWLALATSRPST